MKYYKLNFRGFSDSEEDIFGKKVLSENLSEEYCDLQAILDYCINEIKIKLGIALNKNKITEYQIVNHEDAGNLLVCEQDEYILLINEKILDKKENLISIIYHELCHLYQLEKLFKEKIIFWNYDSDCVSANDQNIEIAEKHLNVNNGHTEYWQELADKINNVLKPAYLIKAYLTSDEHKAIFSEAVDFDYFNLDFDGFSDSFEDIFGKE